VYRLTERSGLELRFPAFSEKTLMNKLRLNEQ
jgi:hypothetical protein